MSTSSPSLTYVPYSRNMRTSITRPPGHPVRTSRFTSTTRPLPSGSSGPKNANGDLMQLPGGRLPYRTEVRVPVNGAPMSTGSTGGRFNRLPSSPSTPAIHKTTYLSGASYLSRTPSHSDLSSARARSDSLNRSKNLISGQPATSSIGSSNSGSVNSRFYGSSTVVSSTAGRRPSSGSTRERRLSASKPCDDASTTISSSLSSKCNLKDDLDDTSTVNNNKDSTVAKKYESSGLVGLRNLGNTCFMNSVLQALSNTRLLLEYCLSKKYLNDVNKTTSSMKGALVNSYAELLSNMWNSKSDTYVSPSSFKSSVARYAPRFTGYSQQDSQEFLRYLLEGLHEDVNRVKQRPKPVIPDEEAEDRMSDSDKADLYFKRYKSREDSYIVDLFVGQLKSTLRCHSCGYKSTTFDPFWDLSLPIPKKAGGVSLQDCINLFTAEETLDGDERPKCAKCKTRRKCSKSFSIHRFPKILVLHLKRFSGERFRSKISSFVSYPVTGLDLSAYAAENSSGCVYNLYAVSEHSGTVYGGHYTAHAKHPYSDKWHGFNDTRVSSASSNSALSSEGYVLFYEQQEHKKLTNGSEASRL